MRIAEVVINTDVKSLDKVFHYLCPYEVIPFCRVEVPFGIGNKAYEGIIVGFVEDSPFKRLKKILRIIDDVPVITPKAFELAKYLRRTCLCPLYKALKLVMPPQSSVKFRKYVILKQMPVEVLKGTQKSVMDTLEDMGGRVEINTLLAAADVKTSATLKALCEKGYIELEESGDSGVKEKTRLICSLSMPAEEAEAIFGGIKQKGRGMKSALQALIDFGSMPLQDLTELAECSPSSIKALEKYGIVYIERQEVSRSPIKCRGFEEYAKHEPTAEQRYALDKISDMINSKTMHKILLHGVTGSGKTEVFLQAVEYCLKIGRKTIVLVPEIALTPQMLERFVGRFGDRVAVLHSGLSIGERFDEWNRIKDGKVDIVVGARSAIFAPIENVGLIVIDEEHETSYKSDSNPRYHAKNVASFRAKQDGAVMLMASATPSLDSYNSALCGRYTLIELSKRYNSSPMPQVKIVDMSAELTAGNRMSVSGILKNEIEKNLHKGEQTILFLNRRGHSTFVSCRSCGHAMGCPHCSVSLTYHVNSNRLFCHYCGYSERNPEVCPKCKSTYIKMFGTGTQKVEEELKMLFPSAVVQRMDTDTTSGKNLHEAILKRFGEQKIDILIGTQMVAKGLDFPNVTLVGVLAADTLLNINDFRASEKAFSQLTQVCGRAGRGNVLGRAVIQTYQPQNDTILLAKNHDYKGFFKHEIRMRKQLDNPPFTKLVLVLFKGKDKNMVEESAKQAEKVINEFAKVGDIKAMYGPSPAPLSRLGDMFRYRILIKYNSNVLDLIEKVYNKHINSADALKVSIDIDINPANLF